jgi:hypothetical protein
LFDDNLGKAKAHLALGRAFRLDLDFGAEEVPGFQRASATGYLVVTV